jgi:uncharacterized Zn finger protein
METFCSRRTKTGTEKMKLIDSILRKLTFNELHDWASEKVFHRGNDYVKRVEQLSYTKDNTLVAWVTGRHRYATSVSIKGAGNFDHLCSCPYTWGPCKHAVAVILAAVECVKRKESLPELVEDSDLHEALYGYQEEDDEGEDDDDLDATTPRLTATQSKVAKILRDKNRDELLDLLVDLSGRVGDVSQHIIETAQLAGGQTDELVRALKAEIRDLTAEPAYYNHWDDESRLPDFSHVEEQLRALTDHGHADAVVQLGEEIWTRGNAQIEQSDDERETAMAIGACLETVLAALPQCSLSSPQQLLWVIDRLLEDEYSVLGSAEKLLTRRAYTRAHWRDVASTLETRLQAMSKPRTPDFHDRYRRQGLLSQLLEAYGRAGWKHKIVPRLEDEADACQCYTRLVDALLAADETERARDWCIQGYARTVDSAAGTASALQDRLRTMAEKEKRYDLVAVYRAQDFFDRPSSSDYNELRKAAVKAKCWPAVRDAAFRYLETGQRPASSDRKDKNNVWPLPSPEVESPPTTRRAGYQQFPDLETLIDIAIMEKRFDDVVDLYQRLRKTKRLGWGTDKTVAHAVCVTHPDFALAIWKDVVGNLIAQVKPRAYEEAAVYLRLMKKVYTRHHRLEDWRRLLEELRKIHKAKRRLMGVLDTLSKKKLVD